MSSKNNQLIIFRLAEEEFGVEITKVQEIIHMKDLTQLPDSSGFMAGIINLRGDIISVIDLRRRFGLKQEVTKNTRIVIIEMNDQDVGLIVDAVSEVLRIEDNNIEDAPKKIVGIKNDYLKGIGKVEDKIIILLDLDKLLTTEEKLKLEKASKDIDSKNII